MSNYVIAGEQADAAVGNDKTLVQPPRSRTEADSVAYIDLTTTSFVGNRVVVLEITDSADVVLWTLTLEAALPADQTNVIHIIAPSSGDGEFPFPVPVDGKIKLRDTADIDVLDTLSIRLFYNRGGPAVPA